MATSNQASWRAALTNIGVPPNSVSINVDAIRSPWPVSKQRVHATIRPRPDRHSRCAAAYEFGDLALVTPILFSDDGRNLVWNFVRRAPPDRV